MQFKNPMELAIHFDLLSKAIRKEMRNDSTTVLKDSNGIIFTILKIGQDQSFCLVLENADCKVVPKTSLQEPFIFLGYMKAVR